MPKHGVATRLYGVIIGCLAVSLLRCLECSVITAAPRVVNPINHVETLPLSPVTMDTNVLPSCPNHSSIDEFPPDFFTDQQRMQGAVLLHIFAAIYFFTLLGVVCNDYFLPSVECICDDLKISKDVAAATFMATATTTPELFTNLISTFVIDSDLGVGTIIGSLMFNTLGVAAVAGMATIHPVKLDRWPITRDCILFCINISFLVWFAWDARITLTESTVLVVLYFVYFIVLFNNRNMMRLYKRYWRRSEDASNEVSPRSSYDLPTPAEFVPSLYATGTFSMRKTTGRDLQQKPTAQEVAYNPSALAVLSASDLLDNVQPGSSSKSAKSVTMCLPPPMLHQDSYNSKMAELDRDLIGQQSTSEKPTSDYTETIKRRKSLWEQPQGSVLRTIWWAYTWPIKCLLTICIPNPKTWRRLYPITFIMCVLFIGLNSYMIVWMITIMGFTFAVPESVMGLTFLAAGGCMPEAISSVLSVRKGEGGIGVSNSLGANSLAILMSLGVPWLIRNCMNRDDPTKNFISLDSADIEYTFMSLLLATVVLYAVISYSKYMLKRSVGFILICVYGVFITLCILLEMDILLPRTDCT